MAKQAPPQPTRRQLSLLLPETERTVVESIRRGLDPIQHALIPAHVTLCRDDELPGMQELSERLAHLEGLPITMAFGGPQELQDGCVLLRPAKGQEEFQALRQAILGPAARPYGAHLTLLHPRNATRARHDLAAIARELVGLTVTFQTIALVEQQGCDPWQVKHEYGSAI